MNRLVKFELCFYNVELSKHYQNYSCGNEHKLIYTCKMYNSLYKIHYMFQTSSHGFINAKKKLTCRLQKTASKFDIGKGQKKKFVFTVTRPTLIFASDPMNFYTEFG